MAIEINGTSGISGVDGSATTPALQGTDTNTGISFGTDEVQLITGGTQRALVDSTGYLRLAGAGIQFNGDTAAANALDDYEEGTWTPDLQFGGGNTGITYAQQKGQYTKIGNRVYFTCYFYLTSKGTSTGQAHVQGLPYTSLGSSNYLTAAVWMSSGNWGSTVPTGYLVPNSTQFRLERQRADGGGVYSCDQTNFNSNTEIMLTGHYSIA